MINSHGVNKRNFMKTVKKIVLATFLSVLLILIAIFALTVFAARSDVIRGDANSDGVVGVKDLMLLRQYLANYDFDNQVSAFDIGTGADVDGDGSVTLKDVVSLRRYLADADAITEITHKDGTATVFGKNGLEYTVTGYKSVELGKFVFNSGLQITFADGCFASEFNRMCFDYESTEPIKVYVTYTQGGKEKTDYFFLEATKKSFRGLIEGYLADKKGIELKKITVDTCENVEARFILHHFYTEVIPLYEDDLCVENGRYKIGVRLSWGGAMTYFEDKLDGDDTLGNLVNIHDTGRLIQQSFYGTYSNGEYVSVPNGNSETDKLWPYNPVQGGDRKNNGSDRLIDVEYDEEKDYIYIVSQALDWAYIKGLTYTYYENTYTIMEGKTDSNDDDYVVVDNVATDFSGWTHTTGGQEIPAVYLVSYFDTLSYYNGIKPWTDDNESIYYERDLVGWENAGIFPLYKGNTETWSIWINTDDNFGFGTYCPNIQRHVAIRHNYNGSKNPMANSTSYVAPSCFIVMQSYKPIEYSYILATGNPEDIRAIFKENKDFTDNASLSENRYDQLITYGKFDMANMDFTVPENADVFCAPRHVNIGYDGVENALRIYVENGNDPYASLNFDCNSDKVINSDDFNTIEIEYMLPMTNSKSSYTFVMFLSAGEVTDFNEANTVKETLVRDGKYHTIKIRVPKSKCQGDLHKIRFDPFHRAAAGDIMYIKSISLTTLDYPELGVDNDMSVLASEDFPAANAYTNVYIDESQNVLALKVEGGTDVSITLDFSRLFLSTVEYTGIQIEYMIPVTNSTTYCASSIYFATSTGTSFNGEKVVGSGRLTVDGEYHTMTFDFTQKSYYWKGNITRLRFDYFQNTPAEGDVMYIKRIRLVSVEDLNS